MEVVPEPIPGGSALARDYIDRYETVEHLYGGDFRNEDSREKRAAWLDANEHQRADRTKIASALRLYNEQHNPHSAVTNALALLEQPGTLVVTGGSKAACLQVPCLSYIRRSLPSRRQKKLQPSLDGRLCRSFGLPVKIMTGTRLIIHLS